MNFLTEQQLTFYQKNGYLHIPNFYSNSDIRNIMEATNNSVNIEGIKVIYEDDGETIRSIMSYHDKNETLEAYTKDKKVLDVVSDLIPNDVYVSQSKINIKKGNEKGKKWDIHRGFTYWNLLDGMPEKDMISVFVYLTDQTVENGAVFGLPGSHKGISVDSVKEESIISGGRKQDTAANLSIQIKNEFVNQFDKEFDTEYFTGKAGDLLIMHSCLLHASKANVTTDERGLMITVYNPINNLPTNTDREAYLCEKFKSAISPVELEKVYASKV